MEKKKKEIAMKNMKRSIIQRRRKKSIAKTKNIWKKRKHL